MRYEYFGPQGQRRSLVLDERDAHAQIGDRVASGFDVRVRWDEFADGTAGTVVIFQSEITGRVWALYYDR